jgi:hypothetical protein
MIFKIIISNLFDNGKSWPIDIIHYWNNTDDDIIARFVSGSINEKGFGRDNEHLDSFKKHLPNYVLQLKKELLDFKIDYILSVPSTRNILQLFKTEFMRDTKAIDISDITSKKNKDIKAGINHDLTVENLYENLSFNPNHNVDLNRINSLILIDDVVGKKGRTVTAIINKLFANNLNINCNIKIVSLLSLLKITN